MTLIDKRRKQGEPRQSTTCQLSVRPKYLVRVLAGGRMKNPPEKG